MSAIEYRKPTMPMISEGFSPDAKRLYKTEKQLHDQIRIAAAHLSNVLRDAGIVRNDLYPKGELPFYQVTLPEVLANLLDSYDNEASKLAAIAYLEQRGYTVTVELRCGRCKQIIDENKEKFAMNLRKGQPRRCYHFTNSESDDQCVTTYIHDDPKIGHGITD